MNKRRVKKIASAAVGATEWTVGAVIRLALRIVFTVLLVFITTALLFTCIFAYYVKTNLNTSLDVSLEELSVSLSSTIWYEDANGDYQELVTLSSLENRIWVDYDNIPKYMKDAAVAIEDKRFYEHKGVDWYRTVGAFANMFLTMKNDFGGSTITQQLIKNTTQNDDVTVQRKLLEIFQALELEKTYTKDEILEWYLNYVYFGQGCNGVQTAAQMYFGKDVWDLSLAECASIVGITNNPSRYNPFISAKNNKERQETILYEMYDQGKISYSQYREAVDEELQFARGEGEVYEQEIYSYYVETVIDDVIKDLMELRRINYETASELLYYGGYQIYCCLDKDIQDQVDAVYENLEGLPQPYYASGQQLQSAIVIMDPNTGEIKALSGGVGEKVRNFGTNRATQSERPCGSSTKPLSVYGPALEYGLITQNTLVNDAKAGEIELEGTNWYPNNADFYNRGIITIKDGVVSSLNTVAAQVLDKLTTEESFRYMTEKLGFTTLVESDRNYAPLSMGEYTYGVKVREMTQAYCAFVNDGVLTESRTYTRVTDAAGNTILENTPETRIVWSSNTCANICSMLQSAVSYGTGYEAYFPTTAVAGKTGTTNNNRDRYFVGFTEYYVAACWTGYDMPEPMYFYGNPAAQIWKKVMQPIHEGLEYLSFPYATVGKPTNIFGDLEEEKEKQEEEKRKAEEEKKKQEEEAKNSPSPSPSASPEVTEDVETTDAPETTVSPDVSETPSDTDAPQTTEPPEGDEGQTPDPTEPVPTEPAA